jgi:uncharacterized protein YndB with AHSA1/START domain
MERDHQDGVVTRNGDSYEIVFVRRLARPIEKVWAALTQPARLADWFAEISVEGGEFTVGARFELHFPLDGYRTSCQVLALEPPRLFAWTWGLPEGPTGLANAVRFELAPDGDGCVFTLTNPGLIRQDLESVAAGWHTHLEALEGAVDGLRTQWTGERERPHLERYKAVLAEL